VLGATGALFYVVSMSMKTVIPLRITSIVSALCLLGSRKGDIADEMFLAGNGKYRVIELGKDIQPGEIFGELALLTPGYRRTRTVQCIESGHVLTLPYDEVRALYFENPEFGFYFLRLASSRLLEAVARAEEMLDAENALRALR
jgi:CRP-like cAMP-binding protein